MVAPAKLEMKTLIVDPGKAFVHFSHEAIILIHSRVSEYRHNMGC